jgi:hypothetical protein
MTPTPGDFDVCTCSHGIADHVHSRGRCRERDSYRLPCECPSFEHDPNDDERPDSDWNEFEPDGREED